MMKKKGFATAALVGTVLFGGAFQTASAESHQSQAKGNVSIQQHCDHLSKQEVQNLLDKKFDHQVNWKKVDWKQNDTRDNKSSKSEEQQQSDQKQQQNQQTEKDPKQNPEQADQSKQASAPSGNKQPQQNQQQSKQEQNSQLSQFEQKVVELTNQEREQRGLSPLKVDTELSKVAREKSKDMASNNYFSHNSPTYGSPFDMMDQFGISYRTAGENIAKGQTSPQDVVDAWMNSEGHRKNILNSDFTHIGVGYVSNGDIWTQQFIGK
ncbi:CAP domain-containing protein [Tuberibacillus sp. Marseille-P3662]|uniref:CAP domain-containing protein n=1 Tax=Tuberibacillus sp. Marseille-P3662 TaxID=1965358 RepID=UPI000A1C80ED|nr:CAP domain-containing protein [Tuberibacillus sp. Marseille-P3662]